jgi:hypothetical protein
MANLQCPGWTLEAVAHVRDDGLAVAVPGMGFGGEGG